MPPGRLLLLRPQASSTNYASTASRKFRSASSVRSPAFMLSPRPSTIFPSASAAMRSAKPLRQRPFVRHHHNRHSQLLLNTLQQAAYGSPVALSKFPVGSSREHSVGRFTKALASAARCCSPSRHFARRCPLRFSNPRVAELPHSRSALPAIHFRQPAAATLHFSSSVFAAARLND